jgi:hypothetical protein
MTIPSVWAKKNAVSTIAHIAMMEIKMGWWDKSNKPS